MRSVVTALLLIALCPAQLVVRRGPISGSLASVSFDSKWEKGNGTAPTSPFAYVSNAGTVTGSVGANSNRVLICVAGFNQSIAGVGTVTMTWNSVSMTQITSGDETVGTRSAFVFGLIAPATGAQTISTAWTGGPANDVVVGCDSFYNANQSTAWQNAGAANGTSTSASITVTSANGNMAFATRVDNNATCSCTVAAGTADWEENAFNGNYAGAHRASVSGSTVITWTLGSSAAWKVLGVDVIHQ